MSGRRKSGAIRSARITAFCAVVWFCGAASAFAAGGPHACSFSPEEYLFTKTLEEASQEFSSLNLDHQYKLYICGMEYIHPPALHLVKAFAGQGERVVPFLSDKLAEARTDESVRDLLRIFVEMHRSNIYDVKKNNMLFELLNKKVRAIRDKKWRESGITLLSEIDGVVSKVQ